MSNDLSCMCMYLMQVLKSVAEVDIVAEEMAGAELLRSPHKERVARSEVGDPLQTSGDRKSEEVSDGATEDGDVGMDELELESGDWDGEVSESEDGEAVTSMGSVPMK